MTQPHTTVCEKGPGEYQITLNVKLEKVISEKDKELAEAHAKICQQEEEIKEKSDELHFLATKNRISEACFDEAVQDMIDLERKIEKLEAELPGNGAAKRAAHANKGGEGCSREYAIVID